MDPHVRQHCQSIIRDRGDRVIYKRRFSISKIMQFQNLYLPHNIVAQNINQCLPEIQEEMDTSILALGALRIFLPYCFSKQEKIVRIQICKRYAHYLTYLVTDKPDDCLD